MVQSAALIRQHMTFGYFDAGGVCGTIGVQSGKKRAITRNVLRGCGRDTCQPSIRWALGSFSRLLKDWSVHYVVEFVTERPVGSGFATKARTLERKLMSLCGRRRICREWIRGTLNSINSDGTVLWGSISSLPNFFYFHALENHLVQWTEI